MAFSPMSTPGVGRRSRAAEYSEKRQAGRAMRSMKPRRRAGLYGLRKLQILAADPVGEKDCRPAADSGEQGRIDLERIKAIAPLTGVKWSQLGGSINDASCLNKTEIYGVVEVHSVDDVARTLAFARDKWLSLSSRR
jgi:hypothetical protein